MLKSFWRRDRNFVVGERSLRAYLAGGNVRFLCDAELSLSMTSPESKEYQDARFYLGIAKAQLRKADESIAIFNDLRTSLLRTRTRGSKLELANKIALQLAYAHIKRYTEDGYRAAEEILQELVSLAVSTDSSEFILQAQSLQVFLYAVIAGRSKVSERRPNAASKAREIGESVLKNPQSSAGVRFETLNGLGIAWMRIGEHAWEERERSWANAEDYFDQALSLLPNSVRVLQNMASLRKIQARQVPNERFRFLEEAKELVTRSLEVNDQDQYPFYQLAWIAVEQESKEAALYYIREGKTKPGAVTEEEWEQVEAKAMDIGGESPDQRRY